MAPRRSKKSDVEDTCTGFGVIPEGPVWRWYPTSMPTSPSERILTAREVADGLRVVEAAVEDCRPRAGTRDPISVRVVVSVDGRVVGAAVKGPLAASARGACVVAAV
jgi:hypothetical protein